jgi:RND family efflux transporter MFP subunit
MRHAGWVLTGLVIVTGMGVVIAATNRGGSAPAASDQAAAHIHKLWHCGMHTQVIQDHPGNCPICGMALTEIEGSGDASQPLVVTVEPEIVQNMGVRTAVLKRGPLHKTVRAVGVLKLAETGARDVSLKVSGWIDELYADQMGMHVHVGQPLFAVYSPEFQVAAEELISAVKSQQLGGDAAREQAKRMAESARRKLKLWDVADEEIDAIAKADRPPKDVVIRSPVTGHVEEKEIVAGSAVQPGMRLMRIADHSKLWLDVQVYEDEAGMVKAGQVVVASIEGFGGASVKGAIDFVYPHVDPMTRTIAARLWLNNPDMTLKPGMFATAQIMTQPVDDALLCPREAVIDTGTRQIAFTTDGSGHFAPRDVRMGMTGDDDMVEILSGLSAGETVVTSGQFLIDAESRTVEATRRLMAPPKAPATQPAGLSVMYCPMTKAYWVQSGTAVANPFVGKEMLDCGSEKKKVSSPAEGKLAEVTAAYLKIQSTLSDDKFDKDAIAAFGKAVDAMGAPMNADLKKSGEALAAAKDIKQAREAFVGTSALIIKVLGGGN